MNNKNKELKVTFDAATIDHLGVKLYSTIPPMLAELISNAWDADAHNVCITLQDGVSKSILVEDDGIGMSFDELNSKFLKIGRNRRVENKTDRTGLGRRVLGKKGLGKLSLFGIGKKITISTVKDHLKTTFLMNYDDIKNVESQEPYKPKIIDCEVKTKDFNGTSVKIEELARKSGFDLISVRKSLLNRLKIFSKEFVVEIKGNGTPLKIDNMEIDDDVFQFSWTFPKDFELNENEFGELYDFAQKMGICGSICTAATPLPKSKQGITLFSRGKLVQENIPFSERGNDNFFQYMSGKFDVDFVNESFEIDNCSTDRKSLAWDSYGNSDLDRLKSFMEKLVSVTQKKWRQQRKDDKENSITNKGVEIKPWLESLSPVERPLAKKLVDAILGNDDITKEAASSYIVCIKDMYSFTGFQNFTKKLEDMNALGSENAIKLLTDWSEIEAKEYAKIALGRITAIEQFEKYVKENASENKVIQKFLEEFPWLLDPKMSKFEREVTYSKVLKEKYNDNDLPEGDRRIDFLCTNNAGIVHVIELKRPSIKITCKQLQQICAYTEFIEKKYPQNVKEVIGVLISDNMTYESGAEKMRKSLESQNIFVKSYSDLLSEAHQYNKTLYELYEKISEAKK